MKVVLGLLVISAFLCHIELSSQDCINDFRSPINYKTVLSGSYGEPRTRHFHAGLDFKQKRGIPRDTIFAVADGYISRISVQPNGYGNALYIDHPCNKTSVYAHLYDFAPNIRAYINEQLYTQKKYKISHRPQPDSLRVMKGQFIGILGSTGRSSGPHLHFEIRNTSSETPINPALTGLKPDDTIDPIIVGIMLYELSPDDQELSRQFFPAVKQNGHYRLNEELIKTKALKVGIGIRTYDQMNGASNHNGIYSLKMKVDGSVAYQFKLDSIPFNKSKFIHAHMDFEEKQNKKYVTKCFVNPGNHLSIYKTNKSKGAIYPFEFRKSKIELSAKDIEGNLAQISFHLGRDDSIKSDTLRLENNPLEYQNVRITPTDSIALKLKNVQLTFDRGTFTQPVNLKLPVNTEQLIDLSQNHNIPTFKFYKISQIISKRLYPKHKYCFLSKNEKGEILRYRSKWEKDSTLVTFVNTFEEFSVGIDTVNPSIRILSLPGSKSRMCKFELKDNFEPIHENDALNFQIFLNGRWTLAQHDGKTSSVWFYMDPKRTGASIDLSIIAKDKAGNTTELKRQFVY